MPIVESAYNPNARSPMGNAVVWQFLSASGRRYGLKQDYWYDGRRDVVASTQAALDYLAQLNAYFEGDWMNAVAAYNAGEGRIRMPLMQIVLVVKRQIFLAAITTSDDGICASHAGISGCHQNAKNMASTCLKYQTVHRFV